MKLGVSTWCLLNTDVNSAVRAIGDAGFEYIEVWGEVPHAYHDWTDRKRLKETLSNYDMTLTLHAPFTDLNVATPFEPVRSAVARTLADFVKFGEFLGASMITFHPGSVHNEALVPKSAENSIRILRGLVKESSGRMTICVENQTKSKSKYVYPLASTIESLELILAQVEGSRFTLDNGHAHVSGLDPLILAEWAGSKLAEIHLSDNAGVTDDHLVPGEGSASARQLVDKVSRSDVLVCLELNPHTYTHDTVISAASEFKAKLAKGLHRS